MAVIQRQPKYRLHRASGQGLVQIDGQRIYLGAYNSPASWQKYHALLAERDVRGTPAPANDLTITELIDAYFAHAERYYRHPDGTPTSEVHNLRQALRPLSEMYAHLAAVDFSPLKLQAVRTAMIRRGWCRTSINRQVKRIKTMFSWAVSQELLPGRVHQELSTVKGLKAGRSAARESDKVRPVPIADVEAVLPFVPRQVAVAIQVQLHSGARPGEVLSMRGIDLETSGDVWVYRPARHKTEHHGNTREIYLGPRAQAVLRPLLKTDLTAFIFSPADAMAARHAKRRADRERRHAAACKRRGNS